MLIEKDIMEISLQIVVFLHNSIPHLVTEKQQFGEGFT